MDDSKDYLKPKKLNTIYRDRTLFSRNCFFCNFLQNILFFEWLVAS